MSRQPVRIFRAPFSGRYFAVTSYTEHTNGSFTAHEKHDVTDDVEAIIATLGEV